MDINKVIEIVRQHKLDEMMTATGGGLAGLPPDEPPVNMKKKKKGEQTILARGLMPGARTRWKKRM